MKAIIVNNAIYCLSISPEIFALKVHERKNAQTDARTVRKHNASGHYVVVGGGINIPIVFFFLKMQSAKTR